MRASASEAVYLALTILALSSFLRGQSVETAASAFPAVYNSSALSTAPLPYKDGDTNLTGYRSIKIASDASNAALPVVVIIPDWEGVGDYVRWRADLLANLGFVGFVADIYGDDVKQGSSLPIPDRQRLTSYYKARPSLLTGRVMAGIKQAQSLPHVDASKTAVIGYCFGGAAALELWRSVRPEPVFSGIAGIATFHASPLNLQNGSTLMTNNPVRLEIFNGARDPGVSFAAIEAFEDTAEAANATWEFTSYGHTSHSFTRPDIPLWLGAGNGSAPGMAYSPTADKHSWWSLRGLLLDVFGYHKGPNIYTAPITS